MFRRLTLAVVTVAYVLAVAVACSSSDDSSSAGDSADSEGAPTTSTETPTPADETVLFSPEGNNLWAYDASAKGSDVPSQRVVTNAADDPHGWDINGQVCTLPDGRIVTGEDTGQPDPPAGWGIFTLKGTDVGDLSAERVARLVPDFAPDDAEPDTFGCGVLTDGRLVTTVIGDSASGPANGQLIMWYPPFDDESGASGRCVLDAGLATAQQIWVGSDDTLFVASARPPTSGVWRYDGPFPDAPSAEGGCGATSPGGSPMVDEVSRDQLIVPGGDNPLVSPNGVVGDVGSGRLFVSSIINGVIAEFTTDGAYVATVLEPPEGETLGESPFSTGTPLGIALGSDGWLYYADLGLVAPEGEVPGPGPKTGSVRRFDPDDPGAAPEVLAADLTFPDSLGFWTAR